MRVLGEQREEAKMYENHNEQLMTQLALLKGHLEVEALRAAVAGLAIRVEAVLCSPSGT